MYNPHYEKNYSGVMDKNNIEEEIDLVGLSKLIWESKKIIIASTTVFFDSRCHI